MSTNRPISSYVCMRARENDALSFRQLSLLSTMKMVGLSVVCPEPVLVNGLAFRKEVDHSYMGICIQKKTRRRCFSVPLQRAVRRCPRRVPPVDLPSPSPSPPRPHPHHLDGVKNVYIVDQKTRRSIYQDRLISDRSVYQDRLIRQSFGTSTLVNHCKCLCGVNRLGRGRAYRAQRLLAPAASRPA
jgi:hypothetical protein